MKYHGKEFVEFLRRLMDFPRRGLLDVTNPNFLDLIDNTVASSAGATIYLPPEIFMGIKPRSNTYPKSFAKKRYSNLRNPLSTLQREKKPPLVEASKPLDGSAVHLKGGPFLNPREKLSQKDCCLCFNYGKECKVLNSEGKCQKVHVCFHDSCRTLFNHNHRFIDHSKAERDQSSLPR